MSVTTIHEAKANLSRLIERAERGEDVVIARDSKPAGSEKTKPGMFRGEFEVGPGFFDPLPVRELEGWE